MWISHLALSGMAISHWGRNIPPHNFWMQISHLTLYVVAIIEVFVLQNCQTLCNLSTFQCDKKKSLLTQKLFFWSSFFVLMTQGHTPCLALCNLSTSSATLDHSSLCPQHLTTVTAACSLQAITGSNSRLRHCRPPVIASCRLWWTKILPSNVPYIHILW